MPPLQEVLVATAASYFEFPIGILLRELKGRIVRLMAADCTVFGVATSPGGDRDWRTPARWKTVYASSFSRIAGYVRPRKLAFACTGALWAALAVVLAGLLAALLAACPALVLGALAGYYTLMVCHWVRVRSLAHAMPSGAVVFAFSGQELEFCPSPAQLRRFCSPIRDRSVAAAMAGVASAVALVAFQTRTQVFDFLFRVQAVSSIEAVLAWAGPVILCLWFMAGAGLAASLERSVVGKIQRCVNRANMQLRRIGELDGYLLAVNTSACALRSDPAQRYRRAVREYLSSHCAEMVLNPFPAIGVVQALKVLAQQETQQTQAAVQQYQNALMQFRELRGYARSAQDLSLKRSVDTVGEKLAQSRKLMELQDFPALSQMLETLQREMQSLEAQLTRSFQSRTDSARVSPTTTQWTSPYEKLGISRDATTEQIRRLRTKLVQIYHPDAFGASPNPARMAEINAAVDQILKWRGEK